MTETRKLRVFLRYSSQDKPIVRELYQRLNAEGWIDPWLDEGELCVLNFSLSSIFHLTLIETLEAGN